MWVLLSYSGEAPYIQYISTSQLNGKANGFAYFLSKLPGGGGEVKALALLRIIINPLIMLNPIKDKTFQRQSAIQKAVGDIC